MRTYRKYLILPFLCGGLLASTDDEFAKRFPEDETEALLATFGAPELAEEIDNNAAVGQKAKPKRKRKRNKNKKDGSESTLPEDFEKVAALLSDLAEEEPDTLEPMPVDCAASSSTNILRRVIEETLQFIEEEHFNFSKDIKALLLRIKNEENPKSARRQVFSDDMSLRTYAPGSNPDLDAPKFTKTLIATDVTQFVKESYFDGVRDLKTIHENYMKIHPEAGKNMQTIFTRMKRK
jgi:hypothetical protein